MSQDQLSGSAVKEVADLARAAVAQTIEIGGRDYSTTPLYNPRKPEPEPDTLVVHTLQSFADYVNSADVDDYRDGRGAFVHVEGPTRVRLCTGIFGEFNQRVVVARADAIVPRIAFGQFQDPEAFIIELLALFEPTADRETVFKVVGNIQSEAVQTVADDGVTQRVTAKVGINKDATVEVQRQVLLRPYRTFPEVIQPNSPFVLRMRSGGPGRPPTCALFECDGGRWQLEAIRSVKEWLAGELSGDFPVYG